MIHWRWHGNCHENKVTAKLYSAPRDVGTASIRTDHASHFDMYKTYVTRAPCKLLDYSKWVDPDLDWLLRFRSRRRIVLQSLGEHVIIDGGKLWQILEWEVAERIIDICTRFKIIEATTVLPHVILAVAHTTTASTKASIITGILKLVCFIYVFIWWIPRIATSEVASIKCTIWGGNKGSLQMIFCYSWYT